MSLQGGKLVTFSLERKKVFCGFYTENRAKLNVEIKGENDCKMIKEAGLTNIEL